MIIPGVAAIVGAMVALLIGERFNAHSQSFECSLRASHGNPCFAFSTFGYVMVGVFGAASGVLLVLLASLLMSKRRR